MASKNLTIHTSLLFDPRAKTFRENISITVDPTTGTVVSVIQRSSISADIQDGDIDLRRKVVMPGFVDAHTHVFLHAYSERSSLEQMRDESIIERTVRATNHLRRALLSGYTTYRDLGTEGMGTFDANLRDAVNRGLITGPRLFVATHCLASTGSYEVRTENSANGTSGPPICDTCDGVDGVRRAVRRRAADGADVIKFYADYRRKVMRFPTTGNPIMFPPTDRNPAAVMFTQEEMNAIVDEARAANLPVAAHAGTARGATMAAKAGVTTVEHVNEGDTETFKALRDNGCIFVPTIAVIDAVSKGDVPAMKARVKEAYDMGVRFAAGGDTGAFSHGDGAKEMELMMDAGIPVEDVLQACMMGGWESCGKEACGYKFGWLAEGTRADIIALDADPREDKTALRKVSFVMKDGKVWKHNGIPVGFIDSLMEEAGHQDPTRQLA